MTTWLVVEDEPDLRAMFAAATEVIGVQALIFANAESALAWIDAVDAGERDGALPDLALLDIRLGGETTGVMVGAKLRDTHALQAMRIVLMTAHRLTPAWEKVMLDQSGADLLLYKPLPPFEDLQRLLQTLKLR